MDTFIKAKTTLRYGYWRDRIIAFLLLSFLLWTALTATSLFFLNREASPAENITVEQSAYQNVTRQQLAERYRDPSLTYFFGK
ncbi:MAG: hypothetical protein AAF528_04685 [Cyanobacteria bacterium P01_C01_bin.121]